MLGPLATLAVGLVGIATFFISRQNFTARWKTIYSALVVAVIGGSTGIAIDSQVRDATRIARLEAIRLNENDRGQLVLNPSGDESGGSATMQMVVLHTRKSILLDQAELLASRGNFEEAFARVKDALDDDKGFARARLLRAKLNWHTGRDLDQAKDDALFVTRESGSADLKRQANELLGLAPKAGKTP
jgi:Flp pilus assembly protein TadD